jgi:hypothetical protein
MMQLLEDAISSLKFEFGKAFKSSIQGYTIPNDIPASEIFSATQQAFLLSLEMRRRLSSTKPIPFALDGPQ